MWANHACRDLYDPEHQYIDSFVEQKVIEPCIPMSDIKLLQFEWFVDFTSELEENRYDSDTHPLWVNGVIQYLPKYFSQIYKSKVGWCSKARLMVITSSPYWALALSILLPLPLWAFLFSSLVLGKNETIFHGRDFAICAIPSWKLILCCALANLGELALLVYYLLSPHHREMEEIVDVYLFLIIAATGSTLWILPHSHSRDTILSKKIREVFEIIQKFDPCKFPSIRMELEAILEADHEEVVEGE